MGADWVFTEENDQGSPDKTGRITYFYKNGKCIGVAAINWPGAILNLKIALERGLTPSVEEL